jgi:hypothetical protein
MLSLSGLLLSPTLILGLSSLPRLLGSSGSIARCANGAIDIDTLFQSTQPSCGRHPCYDHVAHINVIEALTFN